MIPKRGLVFTHRTRLDTSFKPGPGETYAGGPKQVMIITRVTAHEVYYKALVDGKPVGTPTSCQRDRFEEYVGPDARARMVAAMEAEQDAADFEDRSFDLTRVNPR